MLVRTKGTRASTHQQGELSKSVRPLTLAVCRRGNVPCLQGRWALGLTQTFSPSAERVDRPEGAANRETHSDCPAPAAFGNAVAVPVVAAVAEAALTRTTAAPAEERAPLFGLAGRYRYELGEERAALPLLQAYVGLRPDDAAARPG